MKFDPMKCPFCGEPAAGTLEDLTARSDFTKPDKDGRVEYEGYTEVFWDGQMTRSAGAPAKWVLLDRAGHEWPATDLDAKVEVPA